MRTSSTICAASTRRRRRSFVDWLQAHPIAAGDGTVVGLAPLERQTVHIPDVLADPRFTICAGSSGRRRAPQLGVPLLRDGRADRRHLPRAHRGRAVHRPADRAGEDLRRPGGDRHRECAAVRGGAGAHARAERGAAAADGDRRRAQGHQPLGLRPAAGARRARRIGRRPVPGRHVGHAPDARRRACTTRRRAAARSARSTSHSRSHPILPADRSSVAGRVALERRTVHIARRAGRSGIHVSRAARESAAIRTVLGVPLLRDGKVDRRDRRCSAASVEPFTAAQIELVADLRRPGGDRHRECAAVRGGAGAHGRAERGAAAADGDRRRAEGRSAARPSTCSRCSTRWSNPPRKLCDADKGVIFQRDGDALPMVGQLRQSRRNWRRSRRPIPSCRPRHASRRRVALEAQDRPHRRRARRPGIRASTQYQKLGGYRTILGVPLLREGAPVGVFALTRSEVRAFHAEADRAGRDLRRPGRASPSRTCACSRRCRRAPRNSSEALQQQTATADVLKVISRSTFDLQTVLRHAGRIGRPALRRRQGRDHPARRTTSIVSRASLRLLAGVHASYVKSHPVAAGPRHRSPGARCSKAGSIHIPDVAGRPGIHLRRDARSSAASAPSSAFRCCAKASRSASSR